MFKKIFIHIRDIFSNKNPLITMNSYEDYWNNRDNDIFKEGSDRTDLIIRNNIKKKSSVLEIGCGDGRLLEFLKKEKDIIEKGIDISDVAISRAKKRNVNCKVFNILKDELNKKYDYIILCDVIEHISDSELIMKRIEGKYKENIIMSIPNYGIIFNRLRLLFGKVPLDWHWHPKEHLRQWTLSDIKYWLSSGKYGFRKKKILKIYPHVGIPLLKDMFPSLFASGFVIICK
jgi:methionine biosynthesis protein MetW